MVSYRLRRDNSYDLVYNCQVELDIYHDYHILGQVDTLHAHCEPTKYDPCRHPFLLLVRLSECMTECMMAHLLDSQSDLQSDLLMDLLSGFLMDTPSAFRLDILTDPMLDS